MKKTIISILLFSFSLLSLHVHAHEDDHSNELDHSSDDHAVEQVCNFCEFNSDKTFTALSTNSVDIYFENICYNRFIASYISTNLFFLNNKSPPKV
tara:strand:- start:407 stop:694 length:288 start_codon:yes stop_codon:yes gene_type:complete